LVVLVAGCATREPLPSFYVLSGDSGTIPARSMSNARVYVARAQVPTYLASSNLAVRRAGNEIEYIQSARWGEPLDQGIPRAVAADLRELRNLNTVAFSPSNPPPTTDYVVTIRIDRFEGNDNGRVICAGTWEISAGADSAIVRRGSFSNEDGTWQQGDYRSLALALSQELRSVSRRIAGAL
jgi:uncharacterized lipoprotein YmbA